ncbi:MAG: guanylate kinase [Roseburia sp.]|nr:guanylate kinase [Roseburia sp.]
MGRIFCIIGKSSSGKDTIYKRLLNNPALGLKRIVPYTTRPIREGEQEGKEYHFSTSEELEQFRREDRIIECRSYDTACGVWYYFMVKDSRINLEKENYIIIGTLQSYRMTRNYFGADKVVPIYIELEDGERLSRALDREKRQRHPQYEEMCRRFLADCRDFSTENLQKAGIEKIFYNHDLQECIDEIIAYIR